MTSSTEIHFNRFPDSVLAHITHYVSIIEVSRLWASGNELLRAKMAQGGVKEVHEEQISKEWPSILSHLPKVSAYYQHEELMLFKDSFDGLSPATTCPQFKTLDLSQHELTEVDLSFCFPNLEYLVIGELLATSKGIVKVIFPPSLTSLVVRDGLPQGIGLEWVPKTLHELNIGTYGDTEKTVHFFNKDPWTDLRILALRLHDVFTYGPQPSDLLPTTFERFPPNLTRLSLTLSKRVGQFPWSIFPPMLESLEIKTSGNVNLSDSNALSLNRQMQSLLVSGSFNVSVESTSLAALPRSLTRLGLEDSSRSILGSGALKYLPPNLKTLRSSFFYDEPSDQLSFPSQLTSLTQSFDTPLKLSTIPPNLVSLNHARLDSQNLAGILRTYELRHTSPLLFLTAFLAPPKLPGASLSPLPFNLLEVDLKIPARWVPLDFFPASVTKLKLNFGVYSFAYDYDSSVTYPDLPSDWLDKLQCTHLTKLTILGLTLPLQTLVPLRFESRFASIRKIRFDSTYPLDDIIALLPRGLTSSHITAAALTSWHKLFTERPPKLNTFCGKWTSTSPTLLTEDLAFFPRSLRSFRYKVTGDAAKLRPLLYRASVIIQIEDTNA